MSPQWAQQMNISLVGIVGRCPHVGPARLAGVPSWALRAFVVFCLFGCRYVLAAARGARAGVHLAPSRASGGADAAVEKKSELLGAQLEFSGGSGRERAASRVSLKKNGVRQITVRGRGSFRARSNVARGAPGAQVEIGIMHTVNNELRGAPEDHPVFGQRFRSTRRPRVSVRPKSR